MQKKEQFTLYDLMGEDHDSWLKKNSKFGYDLTIENNEFEKVFDEKGIHFAAIDSLVYFCRNIISCYDRINSKEAA